MKGVIIYNGFLTACLVGLCFHMSYIDSRIEKIDAVQEDCVRCIQRLQLCSCDDAVTIDKHDFSIDNLKLEVKQQTYGSWRPYEDYIPKHDSRATQDTTQVE